MPLGFYNSAINPLNAVILLPIGREGGTGPWADSSASRNRNAVIEERGGETPGEHPLSAVILWLHDPDRWSERVSALGPAVGCETPQARGGGGGVSERERATGLLVSEGPAAEACSTRLVAAPRARPPPPPDGVDRKLMFILWNTHFTVWRWIQYGGWVHGIDGRVVYFTASLCNIEGRATDDRGCTNISINLSL